MTFSHRLLISLVCVLILSFGVAWADETMRAMTPRDLARIQSMSSAKISPDGSLIAAKVEESTDANFGYNALTNEFGDLVKMGVIVPTKVERIALQNAASIAGLLLTTDAAITEIKEKKAKSPAGGMDDMDY